MEKWKEVEGDWVEGFLAWKLMLLSLSKISLSPFLTINTLHLGSPFSFIFLPSLILLGREHMQPREGWVSSNSPPSLCDTTCEHRVKP
ncbi:UPF0481 protein [Sesbania bispinosa]|nr:UPF0481 protein [Sesbania bispinosa]